MEIVLADGITEETAAKLVEQFQTLGKVAAAVGNSAQPPVQTEQEVICYFVVLIVAGAFGGFVGVLDPKTNYQLRLPKPP